MIRIPPIKGISLDVSCDASARVCPAIPGKPAIIPAKISIETPFEIPFSVINSPSHISTIVPVDTVSIIGKITIGFPMSSMIGTLACEFIRSIIP